VVVSVGAGVSRAGRGAAWDQPSLCQGWSVRDVGAHLAFSHARVRDVLWPAVRTGFRYNATIKYSAVHSTLAHEQIVAILRGFVGSRRKAPIVTELEPLLDILVHTAASASRWVWSTPCRSTRPSRPRTGYSCSAGRSAYGAPLAGRWCQAGVAVRRSLTGTAVRRCAHSTH